jgi:hypothetical protein
MSEINDLSKNNKIVHSNKIFADVEDIETLTGRSKRQCYRYIEQIKDFFDKKPHQRVTFSEVNQYFGIAENC